MEPVKTGWACLDNRSLTAETLRKNQAAKDAFLNSLSLAELEALEADWGFWARDDQLPPLDWVLGEKYIWVLRCGRGWGKTRTAGEAVIEAVKSGKYKYISICGATAQEVRDIMINGESGIARYCPPSLGMVYKPSVKKVFFNNGAVISIFYGSEPEGARGAQSELLWCDELFKWLYPKETFDNLLLGLRLGENPLCIVTSTPKPTPFIKELEALKDENGNSCVHVTIGTTFDNKANLSPSFINTITAQYKGTRLELQELYAQILDDNPNALFKKEWIEYNRVDELPVPAERNRLIVCVDPAASHNQETSNHNGIIVILEAHAPERLMLGGTVQCKNETHYYVLRDASIIGRPSEWGAMAVMTAEHYHADLIVIEDNQGGDMVESTLINSHCTTPIARVHSVRSKQARALNASLLCEKGRIHFYRDKNEYDDYAKSSSGHYIDNLQILEDELCNWQPGDDSPDRMDAFVHGINYLKPDATNTAQESALRSAFVQSYHYR